jgi:archaeosine-15-forming tRNA-guanine transglycosylase
MEALEMENLGKRIGTTDASITNRIQGMEERLSGIQDTIEESTLVNENAKCKKFLTQKQPKKIWDTMKRPKLRVIGLEESEDSQFKGPENIFNKTIEENFPNIKKEKATNIQEAYRAPNRSDQKRISCLIIIKTLNV